jgi:hypothetical protein
MKNVGIFPQAGSIEAETGSREETRLTRQAPRDAITASG